MVCARGGGLRPSPHAGSPARKPASPGLRSGLVVCSRRPSTAGLDAPPIPTIPGRSERAAFVKAAPACGDGEAATARAEPNRRLHP